MKADPAAWLWLVILGLVIVGEGVLIGTHRTTLSNWLRRHRLVKWVGVVALAGFIAHVLTARTAPDPVPPMTDGNCL